MLGTDSEPQLSVSYMNKGRHTQLLAIYPVAKPVHYPSHGFELSVFPLIMDITESISTIAKEVSKYSINPIRRPDRNLKMEF